MGNTGTQDQGATVVGGTQAYKCPQLHKIITDVITASATRRILFVGDSRCAGANSGSGPNSAGWFQYLPQALASLIALGAGTAIPVQRGLCIPVSLADTRWTIGANWGFANWVGGTNVGWGNGFGSGGALLSGNASSTTSTFTPGASAGSYDTFDVYYAQETAGFGGISANFSGGANTALTVNGSAQQIVKTSVTGAAGSGNACNLLLTGAGLGGSGIIFGVEPRLSTTPTLLLGQAGVNGSAMTDWSATPAVVPYGSVALINFYNPDLVVWNLGLNDVAKGDTPATTTAALLSLINATVGLSKSIIMTGPNVGPSDGGYPVNSVQTMMQALAAFGATEGIPVIDLCSAWGGVNAYTLMNAVGYYSADEGHFSAAGYIDQARFIAQSLAGLAGTM